MNKDAAEGGFFQEKPQAGHGDARIHSELLFIQGSSCCMKHVYILETTLELISCMIRYLQLH